MQQQDFGTTQLFDIKITKNTAYRNCQAIYTKGLLQATTKESCLCFFQYQAPRA